ncbi:antibiotic biosynthesis monooxygenase family protein [Kurthia sibirica]|uniref:ABM domain-containing protein n=1 Tax=Kurthia sibirica TaxID=202750 RepID=A0A2U3AJC6_9BACL|nr:antibiotic biosynthesis monooxygenase family protein [Kurthia sibirica]PWI24647.1 hypothetical protein DEX24_12535 [Kurthia sibirica]GEK33479.1 hypothetical protein KSI01_10120 [Kurthia sibirica]
MFLYLTAGTSDFMEMLQKKYDKENMIVLYSGDQSLLMHHTDGKTKFATPHSFSIVDSKGEFTDRGFFTVTYVDIFDDRAAIFEERLKSKDFGFLKEPGFIAYKLLKPIKATTFAIIIQWSGPDSYYAWKMSDAYKHDFDFMPENIAVDHLPTTLSVAPYTKEYMTTPSDNDDTEKN